MSYILCEYIYLYSLYYIYGLYIYIYIGQENVTFTEKDIFPMAFFLNKKKMCNRITFRCRQKIILDFFYCTNVSTALNEV